MKATKPRILVLVVGVVVIGTGGLYLAKYLANHSPGSTPEGLLSTGMELFEKKEYKEARATLEKCYEEASDKGLKNRALLYIARCYTGEDDREKAIEFWGKVLENEAMKNEHAEAFYSVAKLRSAGGTEGGPKAAEDYYKKAAAVGSGSRFGDLAEIELARRMLDKGDLRKAEQTLDKVRDRKRDYPELRKATFQLNMKLLFSPMPTEVPESQDYFVKERDTLDQIAKRFGTTSDLLKESNGVEPRRLQIGKRLKVVTGKFRLKVSRSKHMLQLVSKDVVLNEYPIGTGKYGSTPVGTFKIADKVKEPPWFKDGRMIPYGHPENVLGTRWMKLESADGQKELTGYGIHGTDDESSIGKESSQGCIRLLNRDVEELYKIVPIGTEVVIEE